MNPPNSRVKQLIENKDYKGLRNQLAQNSALANEGITIPYDSTCLILAHPLHRLCDPVFSGRMTDEEAIRFAEIFLEFGADIDGDKGEGKATPLLAAASLHAEQVGLFYIENGAYVHYRDNSDGASALHWASFTGREKLVDKLIKAKISIDDPDHSHNSTPLGWTLHCLESNDTKNTHNQLDCIKLLLKNGADMKKLDKEQRDFLFSLAKHDAKLKKLLA